jgi:uncharacterized protein
VPCRPSPTTSDDGCGVGVVFLASTVAFAGVPGMSGYGASKAHALTFAEGFAREVAGDGVAVLALCLGPTRADIRPTGAAPTLLMRPEAMSKSPCGSSAGGRPW